MLKQVQHDSTLDVNIHKKSLFGSLLEKMGEKRLELLHISAPDPKSGASTNFATRPIKFSFCRVLFSPCYKFKNISFIPLMSMPYGRKMLRSI